MTDDMPPVPDLAPCMAGATGWHHCRRCCPAIRELIRRDQGIPADPWGSAASLPYAPDTSQEDQP